MESQKVIFVLLIVTVILSIGSMIFVFSLNLDYSGNSYDIVGSETINSGNVQLSVIEPPNSSGGPNETK